MRNWVPWIFGLALAGTAAGGTPEEAEAIRTGYRKEMAGWMEALRAAPTLDRQREVWAQRPDAAAHARRMWQCIGGQLDEPWTLGPAAWLLRMGAALRSGAAAGPETDAPQAVDWTLATTAVREALERRHLRSTDPGLPALCMALVEVPDGMSLALLEKVHTGHPAAMVRGVAALAISMVLKTMGEEGDVMARRLRMLREAIIASAEVEIDGVTVAKIAEDELFVIRHLSKGRRAPDLSGTDVAGRPLKLSDFDGKVVVLLFWATWNDEADRVLEMAGNLAERLKDKPFALVGVNGDPTATLRELVKHGTVTWPNFSDPQRLLGAEFRLANWPAAFVLDRQRVIRYIGAPGSFVDLTVDAVLGEGG